MKGKNPLIGQKLWKNPPMKGKSPVMVLGKKSLAELVLELLLITLTVFSIKDPEAAESQPRFYL
jgi:hypothetical protein